MATPPTYGPSKTPVSSPAARLTRQQSEASGTSRAERHSVGIEGALKHPNGSTLSIKLVDLSYDGCRIEAPTLLEPGDRVQIIAKGSITDAVVRWYSNGQAGLSFNGTGGGSPKPGSLETIPRDEPRISTAIEATMQRHGKQKYPVTVYDMSTAGCQVEFVDRPDVGETVHMRFSGLQPLEASVRWIAGIRAGVEFERPIHPAVFDLLIRKPAAER